MRQICVEFVSYSLLMGGGTQGGQVFARWPVLSPDALNNGDLAITTDYRDVLAEVLTQRLKKPAVDQVFPHFTAMLLGLVVPR